MDGFPSTTRSISVLAGACLIVKTHRSRACIYHRDRSTSALRGRYKTSLCTCSKSSGGRSGAHPVGSARTSAGAGNVPGENTWSLGWCGAVRNTHLVVHSGSNTIELSYEKTTEPVLVFLAFLSQFSAHRIPEAHTADLCMGVYSENLDRFGESIVWKGCNYAVCTLPFVLSLQLL